MPGYQQTEVGIIPNVWTLAIASEVCDLVVDCKNRTPPVIDSEEFAVVRTPNVRNGKFVREDLRFTNEKSFREWTTRAVPQAGDILITREAPLGEVCLVPKHMNVCLGQRMMLYRPTQQKIDNIYFLYALMSKAVQNNLQKKIGGSTVGHAKVNDIRNLVVPLPSTKTEQEAIAKVLSDADSLIESLEQLITKKINLKKGAIQDLITGKKRIQGFSGKWKLKRLGDIADIDSDNLSREIPSTYAFNYISLEDVDAGSLRSYSEQVFGTSPSRARRRLKTGDILVSTVRPNLQSHLLFTSTQPNWVCSTGFSIVRCKHQDANPGYVFFHLFSYGLITQIEALLTGSNYPAINGADVRALEIPIPGLPEQNAIAAILSDMDAEIAALESKLDKTRQLKQGMMQNLLTGKIRLV